jgi:hypothetical protein
VQFLAPNKLIKKDISIQSLGTTRIPILGLALGKLKKKCHLDVAPAESLKINYREWSHASSQRLWAV